MKLVPNNIILFIYVIVGVSGNGCVILTYLRSKLWKKEERYFIPFLSVVDLLAAFVCASFGMTLNLNQATFHNTILCKSWWFFAGFTTLLSMLLLVVIAIQRRMRICTYRGKSMDFKCRRLALMMVTVSSLSLSIPMPYFYGTVSFHDRVRNITGKRCSRMDDVNKVTSLIYGSILIAVAFVTITTLILIYLKIGLAIYAYFRHSRHKPTEIRNTNLGTVDEFQIPEESRNKAEQNSQTKMEHVIFHSSNEIENCDKKQKKDCSGGSHEHKIENEKINKRTLIRISFMFMLITLIFLICYIPKVTVMFLEANSPNFWEELSETTRPVVLFVYRMFIINNVTNPFIYAFFDRVFVSKLKESLCF